MRKPFLLAVNVTVLICLCAGQGCTHTHASPEADELFALLMEGYHESCPGLYHDNPVSDGPQSSRLAALLDALGQDDYYAGGVWIRAYGTELWFLRSLKYFRGDNDESLVLGNEGPPEPVRFAKGVVTDNRREIGRWTRSKPPGTVLQLANGRYIPSGGWGTKFDDKLSFFSRAYEKYDPARMTIEPAFVYVYSVADPNHPVYASKLERLPDHMLRVGNDLYIIGKDKERPVGLHIEICSVQNDRPVFQREIRIPCPKLLFAERLEFDDLDPTKDRLLLSVHKSWPYRSEPFLYSIGEATICRLKKRRDGHPIGFLYPTVLQNAVHYAGLRTRVDDR